MKLRDILYICSCITGISSIPTRVYVNKTLEQSYGLNNMSIDPLTPYVEELLSRYESISYYCTPFYQFFGTLSHKNFIIIFGPVGQTEYTQQEKRDYAFALGISPIDFDGLLTAMAQIPPLTLENFLHFLLLVNFYFNGQQKDIGDIVASLQMHSYTTVHTELQKAKAKPSQEGLEKMPSHNTRSYEKEMLNFVREGDLTGLKAFLSSQIHGNVGKLSNEQIRQQKNLFIVAATLVSRAAMDGGMYEGQAYQLSDMYIRRCEELFSLEAIMQLNYEMALSFTEKVAIIGQQTALSPLVASVVTYIRQNISGDLSLGALSSHFFIHRNQLSIKFKDETGQTPSKFVTQERIRRAKNLLTNTDKSLAEISNYLGFSSQSYFHTIFRCHTGETPMRYRSRNQRIHN